MVNEQTEQDSEHTKAAKRMRLSPEVRQRLEATFEEVYFPGKEMRKKLCEELDMSPRAIQIWFQNRRQTWRRDHNATKDQGKPIQRTTPSELAPRKPPALILTNLTNHPPSALPSPRMGFFSPLSAQSTDGNGGSFRNHQRPSPYPTSHAIVASCQSPRDNVSRPVTASPQFQPQIMLPPLSSLSPYSASPRPFAGQMSTPLPNLSRVFLPSLTSAPPHDPIFQSSFQSNVPRRAMPIHFPRGIEDLRCYFLKQPMVPFE